MLALALTLALAAPPSPKSDGAPPAVVVLPFLANGTVSVKEAHGITALVRRALEKGGYAKVLPQTSDDDKQSQKCQRDPACFGSLADVRGADFVVAGVVTPVADGLQASLIAVRPKETAAARSAAATVQGNDGDGKRLDRLARTLVKPETLTGSLEITGDAGADVELDGRKLGTLPLDGPIAGLLEGDHVVVVTKAGYEELRHTVTVTWDETATMKAVLLGARAGSSSSAPEPGAVVGAGGPSHVDAWVVGGIGAGLLVAGAVVGALSLKDSLDVEARAKVQQLAFPRDSGLVHRGQIEAWTADGLYAGALVAGAAAAALWFLEAPASGDGGAE